METAFFCTIALSEERSGMLLWSEKVAKALFSLGQPLGKRFSVKSSGWRAGSPTPNISYEEI